MQATGFIIDGKRVYPEAFKRAGITVRNYLDDPRLALDTDGVGLDDGTRRRTEWIRGAMFHTTSGVHPQPIRTEPSPSGQGGENVARYWSRSDRQAGSQLIVDTGKEILCLCDLKRITAYHGGGINDVSIGVEIVQLAGGVLYEDELDVGVLLADFLTGWFDIQRQCPASYTGPIPRLQAGGKDVVGVYGHRDQTDNRGRGDPGDAFMAKLLAAGYEPVDFKEGDLRQWKARQKALGMPLKDCDGVPGPTTVRYMRETYGRALWVPRPIDAEIATLRAAA